MARVTVRDVVSGGRRRGTEPDRRDLPAGFTAAAVDGARAGAVQPMQPRPGSFLEVATATAETLRRLLGVDRVLVLRIFGDTVAELASAPGDGARYSARIAGGGEAAATPGGPDPVTRAVERVARDAGAFGSAGAGMHSLDGTLIGAVVALAEDRLPWAESVYG